MTSPVIEISELTKDHVSHILRKRFRVLESLSLKVNRNETFGLLGLNGAGKTTTLKLLLGLLRPTAGSIKVLDEPAGDLKSLSKIGFLPENPYFYSYLTPREFLDFTGQLFGIAHKQRQERSRELLQMVSLHEQADVPVRKFSKGMLQRLGIAQTLINDPELIFFDEPMSGLDPIGRRDVRLIMVKLKEQGRTVFFNSHLLPDVNDVCDRVAILHRGKLAGEESIANISAKGNYRDLEEYFLEVVNAAEASRGHTLDQKAASGTSAQ
jgi:ABC-2 type transport system ATP-binding protein